MISVNAPDGSNTPTGNTIGAKGIDAGSRITSASSNQAGGIPPPGFCNVTASSTWHFVRRTAMNKFLMQDQ